MNNIEKTLAKKYLKRISSSEVTYLDETIKSNSLLDYKLFPEYDGIYTYSIDNNTYEFLFTFKKECIDYSIAMFLDKKLDEAIKNKQDKRLYVVCDLNQTTLYQLLCKKDFDKAHRGVEYRI